MEKRIAFLLVLIFAASSALTAGTADSSKEVAPVQTPPPENPWSFSLMVYAWASGINGTISAADLRADVDVSFDDILDHLDMAFAFATQVRYKRWSFSADWIYARLSDDIDPPRGLLFSSTHEVLKENIITLELGYRVVDAKSAFLDLFAGARIYSFETQIVLRRNLALRDRSASGTQTWADPIVGLRGRYYFSRAWYLNFYGDIGGFGAGSELSWQALGGVGVGVSRWCDMELGYRALGFDYEPGISKQDIITHGPILGAIFRF